MAVNNSTNRSTSPPEKELLKVREAAEILGCCGTTVRSHMNAGHLPFVRTGERKGYRIERSDLDAFINSRKYRFANPKPTPPKTQLNHLL